MYKLIAIDMDGTLLNDKHQVSDKVKETLREAKQQGVKIVLCSGRPIVGMRHYINELQLNETDDYAIAFNGALLEYTKTKEILSALSLGHEDLVELYRLSREIDTPMQYFDFENLYTPDTAISRYTVHESYLNGIPLHFSPVENFPEDRPIPNIMYVDDPDRLNETIKQIPDRVLEKFAFAQSAPFFVEFTHPQATKGNAVKALAERLGIKQSEVMALGDNHNDLSMIEYAGCGVAMENAIPAVKEAADFQTLSNNDHGVAHAIQKLVL